jgi:tetratricopeptide (TPR) repeat protein
VSIERFMIVDDADTNILFFEVLLKELGLPAPVSVRTAPEALRLLDSEHTQFVITAWEMNPMPGTVFVQRARAKKGRKFLPFLLYSKRMTSEDINLTADLGYKNVLPMPFEKQVAKDLLKKIIDEEEELDPAEKTLRKITGYLDENKPSEALKLFDQKLHRNKVFVVRAQTLLGDVWCRLMKYDKAEEAVNKALEEDPDNYEALRIRSQVMSKQGRHEEAIQVLLAMKEKSPKNIMTMVNLGTAYVEATEFDKASEVFKEATAVDDGFDGVKEGEAKVAFQKGDMKLASQLVSELESGDEMARYLNTVAIGYVAMKNWDESIQTYNNAIKVLAHKGLKHLLYFNLGLAYKKQGKMELALGEFCKSFMANPKYDRAYSAIAFLVQEFRKKGQALPAAVEEVKRVRSELHGNGSE